MIGAESLSSYHKPMSSHPLFDIAHGLPVGVFEVATGKLAAKSVLKNFWPVAVSPDGQQLIGARRMPATVEYPQAPIEFQIADIATGELKPLFETATQSSASPIVHWPVDVSISHDNKWLGLMEGNILKIREISGSIAKDIPLQQSSQIALDPAYPRTQALTRIAFRNDNGSLQLPPPIESTC